MLNVALWIYSVTRKKPLLGEISASLLMIKFFVGINVLYMKIDKTLIIFNTF